MWSWIKEQLLTLYGVELGGYLTGYHPELPLYDWILIIVVIVIGAFWINGRIIIKQQTKSMNEFISMMDATDINRNRNAQNPPPLSHSRPPAPPKPPRKSQASSRPPPPEPPPSRDTTGRH